MFGVATLELIVRVVSVVIERGSILMELQVHRNRPNIQPGEDAWGFGQIIAVILILGNLIDIAVAVRKRFEKKTPPEPEP